VGTPVTRCLTGSGAAASLSRRGSLPRVVVITIALCDCLGEQVGVDEHPPADLTGAAWWSLSTPAPRRTAAHRCAAWAHRIGWNRDGRLSRTAGEE
jgi:hypothetical protein